MRDDGGMHAHCGPEAAEKQPAHPHRRVTSFRSRRSTLTDSQQATWDRRWPAWGALARDDDDGYPQLDVPAWFHRAAPLVLEVVRDPDGRRIITPVGASMEIPCDLALLAIGFEGAERMTLLDELGITLSRRGVITCGSDWQTSAPGVFVCGDAHRGASLVVWAIAEGRAAAHAVDAYLMGESDLPEPVRPNQLPLAVV